MKTLQRTLAIVKPDAVAKNAIGDIIEHVRKAGLPHHRHEDAGDHQGPGAGFYAVHAGKPFYDSLADFMSRGPDRGAGAGKRQRHRRWRELMGPTNPAQAAEGTIRKKWGANIEDNAVHGSDAEDTARFELSYFFAGYELE